MRLPTPRGPWSHALFSGLRDERAVPRLVGGPDDDDLQISLWALYELHYRGFEDVDDRFEWDPDVLAARRRLEEIFEERLRRLAVPLVAAALTQDGLAAQLEHIVAEPAPSIASYLHRTASRSQFIEFLAERSVYHLKESDPHTWALPRLTGRPKAALVEIQYDEYGAGDPSMIHQQLYTDALVSAGLDDTYGAYVDDVAAHTLAVNNAMSLFGLHRRLRGASMGHLAAFEMTSSLPCRRIAQGAGRLELPDEVIRYFDEHVEADAVHEQLAVRSLCVPLVEDEPHLRADVLLGAAACVLLDAAATEATLRSWKSSDELRDDSAATFGPDLGDQQGLSQVGAEPVDLVDAAELEHGDAVTGEVRADHPEAGARHVETVRSAVDCRERVLGELTSLSGGYPRRIGDDDREDLVGSAG
jgi:hypothetical protein